MTTSDRLSQIKARAEKARSSRPDIFNVSVDEATFLLELVERYHEALRKIPAPDGYGAFSCCGSRRVTLRDKGHTERCWYMRVKRALGEAENV